MQKKKYLERRSKPQLNPINKIPEEDDGYDDLIVEIADEREYEYNHYMFFMSICKLTQFNHYMF